MSRVHFERQQTVYLKIPIDRLIVTRLINRATMDRLIAAMDRPSYG